MTKIKLFCATSDDQLAKFKKLRDALIGNDVYVPIELQKYVDVGSRKQFSHFLFKLKDKGLPYILKDRGH